MSQTLTSFPARSVPTFATPSDKGASAPDRSCDRMLLVDKSVIPTKGSSCKCQGRAGSAPLHRTYGCTARRSRVPFLGLSSRQRWWSVKPLPPCSYGNGDVSGPSPSRRCTSAGLAKPRSTSRTRNNAPYRRPGIAKNNARKVMKNSIVYQRSDRR